MPGLDPVIHLIGKKLDCRGKPGNDEREVFARKQKPRLAAGF
jgi:hypothetical protein